MPADCKHSRHEVFEDAKGRGFFAECEICGSAGPLKETAKDAKDALKKVRAERPHGQGGFREGSGRKRRFKELVLKGYTIKPTHKKKVSTLLKKLNAARKKKGLKPETGESAAMRAILEHVDLDAIVKAAVA